MRVEHVGPDIGTARPIEDFYEYWRRQLEMVGAPTEPVATEDREE